MAKIKYGTGEDLAVNFAKSLLEDSKVSDKEFPSGNSSTCSKPEQVVILPLTTTP